MNLDEALALLSGHSEVDGLSRSRLAAFLRESSEAHDASERLYRRLRLDFATVVEVAHQIHSRSLDLDLIQNYTLNMVMGQFGVIRATILRRDNLATGSIVAVLAKNVPLPDLAFPVDGPFARRLVHAGRPVGLDGPEIGGMEEAGRLRAGGMAMACPLVKTGQDGVAELMGLLCLGDRVGGDAYGPQDVRFLGLLSNLVAISLYNAHLYHRSIYDSLTGVHSRGYFDLALANEVERARRYRRPGGDSKALCLAIADLDRFKAVNDTHGHQVGDEVLRAVACATIESVRSTDVVARYGGEEFAVILPETDKPMAEAVAERIRRRIAQAVVQVPGNGNGSQAVRVTASVGLAAYPADAQEAIGLVRVADQALYAAKAGGRDRTVPAGGGTQ